MIIETLLNRLRQHRLIYSLLRRVYRIYAPLHRRILRGIYSKDPHKYWEQEGKTYIKTDSNARMEHSRYYEEQERFLVSEIRNLKPQSVLEVGCGYGRLLKLLSQAPGIKRLTGVDISQTQLEKAKDYLAGNSAEVIQADVTKGLPFMDNEFDVVFTSGVVMHIPPPHHLKAYAEMVRVSRKYVVHNEDSDKSVFKFGHNNERFYRKQGHRVIKSLTNPYFAGAKNIQFIVVELNKQGDD